MSGSAVAIEVGAVGARERAARRFFLVAAFAMLLILVVGFSPTLLLRPYFSVPPIPGYLVVHGVVLCAWFVWFCVQCALIAANRTNWHRRSGVVGVALAVCVVAASAMAIVNWVPRMREIGTDFTAEGTRIAAGIVGDTMMLLQFIPLIALAVLWRRRPALHKRLMFLASLAILGPAASRTPATFAALGLAPVAAPFIAYVLFTVLAPITYDLLSRGRPHVATVVCVPLNFGGVVLSFAVASNDGARAFLLGLF